MHFLVSFLPHGRKKHAKSGSLLVLQLLRPHFGRRGLRMPLDSKTHHAHIIVHG